MLRECNKQQTFSVGPRAGVINIREAASQIIHSCSYTLPKADESEAVEVWFEMFYYWAEVQ